MRCSAACTPARSPGWPRSTTSTITACPRGPAADRSSSAGCSRPTTRPWRGHNLKISYEYFDPDRDVSNDQQNRWSFVYEWTPIQFVQIRGGARLYDGIPQQPTQNQRLYFVELHGFF